ncbi:MAG: flagellar hook-basal body complex protein FliE [Geminicoccaceae bacterium]|nr:flagellar hook-basal body complex protein FliE [Geminicoccaceae bacterium]
MKTTPARALAAYAAAAISADESRTSAAETGPDGGFAALLRHEFATTVATLRHAEATAVKGLLGEASLQEVVEAISAAELGLQKVTAIRDRVIAAYQEILRMPI